MAEATLFKKKWTDIVTNAQVLHPAATKAKPVEERGLFTCWPPEKVGDSFPKAHLNIERRQRFVEEGEENLN